MFFAAFYLVVAPIKARQAHLHRDELGGAVLAVCTSSSYWAGLDCYFLLEPVT